MAARLDIFTMVNIHVVSYITTQCHDLEDHDMSLMAGYRLDDRG
jgi:ribosomal protein S12